MSFPAILNVLIGLTTMYLILSLIASWVNEWLAHMGKIRATELKFAIEEFLGKEEIKGSMGEKFFANPLISNLCEKKGGSKVHRYPSYIPPMTFAEVTLQMLLSKSIAELLQDEENAKGDESNPLLEDIKKLSQAKGDLKKSELAHIILAKARPFTLDPVLEALAAQFNDKMKRLFGTYQRKMSSYALGTGIFLAIVLNIDSIAVTQALYTNGAASNITTEYVQKLAPENFALPNFDSESTPNEESSATANEESSDAASEESPQEIDPANLLRLLDDLKLPIGWSEHNPFTASGIATDRAVAAEQNVYWARLFFWTSKIAGYILTALAVSRGAPFWYDLLSKLVTLRTSLQETTEEKPPEKKDKVDPTVTVIMETAKNNGAGNSAKPPGNEEEKPENNGDGNGGKPPGNMEEKPETNGAGNSAKPPETPTNNGNE